MRLICTLFCAILFVASFRGNAISANTAFDVIEVRLVDNDPNVQGPQLLLEGTQQIVEVSSAPLLSAHDFIEAGDIDWTEGKPGFLVQLTPAGAEKLNRLSADNVGRSLALIFDGKLLATPRILDPIVGGGFLLTMESETDARELVAKVNQALASKTR